MHHLPQAEFLDNNIFSVIVFKDGSDCTWIAGTDNAWTVHHIFKGNVDAVRSRGSGKPFMMTLFNGKDCSFHIASNTFDFSTHGLSPMVSGMGCNEQFASLLIRQIAC